MAEIFHSESGEWNHPVNLSSSAEIAKEPTRQNVLQARENGNMFGAGMKLTSQANSGQEKVDHHVDSPKCAESTEKVASPKKANPFV